MTITASTSSMNTPTNSSPTISSETTSSHIEEHITEKASRSRTPRTWILVLAGIVALCFGFAETWFASTSINIIDDFSTGLPAALIITAVGLVLLGVAIYIEGSTSIRRRTQELATA